MKDTKYHSGFSQPDGYRAQLQSDVLRQVQALNRSAPPTVLRRLSPFLAIAASILLLAAAYFSWWTPSPADGGDEQLMAEAIALYTEVAYEEVYPIEALSDFVRDIDAEVEALDAKQ